MSISNSFAFAVILIVTGASAALAEKAEVTHKPSSCGWFLAEDASGYILMEWYGGNDPEKGEHLVGELHSYGMKNIYNIDADAEVRVWIDDFMLGKEEALERLHEECE